MQSLSTAGLWMTQIGADSYGKGLVTATPEADLRRDQMGNHPATCGPRDKSPYLYSWQGTVGIGEFVEDAIKRPFIQYDLLLPWILVDRNEIVTYLSSFVMQLLVEAYAKQVVSGHGTHVQFPSPPTL